MLLQREARRIPAFGESSRGIVDRKTGEISQIGPRNALVEILVMQRAPLAGELALSPDRREGAGDHHQETGGFE